VVIGNEAVFTRQPYAATGLTGMDLVRLGLERARSAADAVEVMLQLLETYGQGGGCGHENRSFTYHNSFLIADPGQAFVLETAGRYWATERVSGARAISNGLTIPGFADRHADWLRGQVAACAARRSRSEAGARTARGPGDLFAVLRDHGPRGSRFQPHYSPINGALSSPCAHAGGLVAATQTTASWVADLRPDRLQHWVTGTAAPCLGLFKPIAVQQPLDLGPVPTDHFDDGSLWWRHERLHRRVMQDPARLGPLATPDQAELERRWLAEPPPPAEAWATAQKGLDAAWERVRPIPVQDTRPWWVRRYWQTRNARAGLPD
jgi:dipeptidase